MSINSLQALCVYLKINNNFTLFCMKQFVDRHCPYHGQVFCERSARKTNYTLIFYSAPHLLSTSLVCAEVGCKYALKFSFISKTHSTMCTILAIELS